ncbi:MAG: type II toxin-antitoxin system RelE/ParE family toxin [Candidatus Omnitrophica bacterium]|nr:type II toxin-antitoxin system RelE/ParE family toxin [Candidatus Omnitrophota bacterium]
MKHVPRFPSVSIQEKFHKVLIELSQAVQDEIMKEIEKLVDNPYPYGDKGFKKLKPPIGIFNYVAQYRLRIGDYRVLYDVDNKRKVVWILALRRRNEQTYK